MSIQALYKTLRKQLENTIIKARNVAETAARNALERVQVGVNPTSALSGAKCFFKVDLYY
jgi:hypothetical protein